MAYINKPSTWLYWLTITLAMGISIIPWPRFFLLSAPDWVMLTLIYWNLTAPEEASVGKAWCAGLLADVLTGQLLGQYALSYAAAIFICVKQHKRIRNFPMIQQSLSVFGILLISKFILFWIERINHQLMPAYFWLPVLTGALIWPVIYIILRKVRLS